MTARNSQQREAAVNAPLSIRASRVVAPVLFVILCAGCETRVVSGGGGFKAIPGASGGVWRPGEQQAQGESWEDLLARQEAERAKQLGMSVEQYRAERGTLEDAGTLRLKDAQGTITLICKAPAHVLHHLITTLQNGEHDLLYDFVLSDELKRDAARAGRSREDVIDDLIEHFGQIRDLYATMPMGERTPGVYQEVIGRNRFRLRSAQAKTMGLKLTAFDVVIEEGNFRLLAVR